MELKPGYKQTEVGVIPEEWDHHQLYELTRSDSPICYGIVQPGPYIESGIPVLAIKNLNTDYRTNVHRSSSGIEKQYIRSRILPGDVLLSVKGTTGRVGIVPEHFHGNISRDLARIRLSDENVPRFYFQMLQSDMAQRCLEIAVVGTTRSELSIGILKQIKVVRPPKEEQQAIAATLSDVDALIAALDKLIAKKCAIKTAAMQQLLAGKQRLPGFSGEWVIHQLSSIGAFRGGNGFPTKYQGLIDGNYPFYKVSDMNNEGNSTFMINSNNWISETIRKAIGATVFPKHSIVFAKIGAAIFLERKKILSQASCIDNNMMGFIVDEDCADYRFVHYVFLNIQLGKLVSTTALPSLNGKEIGTLEFAFPKVEEQQAIATVLSDMDAEIAALEARRDKTRAIKQGVMQELLTGRTRLV